MNISSHTVWNSCIWEDSGPAILGRRCALGGVGWHLLTRGGLHGGRVPCGPGRYYALLIHGFCCPLPTATAPQQEADPEVNTETLTKSSQGTSSSTQAAPTESSASKEKETPAEKSKDGGSVSICPTRLGAKQNLRPAPLPPPRRVCLQAAGGGNRVSAGLLLLRCVLRASSVQQNLL